jgi:calnexin
MKAKARHHAISCRLNKTFQFNGLNLIVQYDIQFRNGQECGGAYLKLLTSPSGNLSLIDEKSSYTIMFGPDKCSDDQKIHFIFNHLKNEKTRELHWKNADLIRNLNEVFLDSKWHLFRLTLRPDNSFEIMMDKKVVGKGNLLDDFEPPVNPISTINQRVDPHFTKAESEGTLDKY